MRYGLLFILFISSYTYSQSEIKKDAHVWTGIQLSIPFTKKFSTTLESQTRFNQNASAFRQSYGELTAKYDIGWGLYISGTYRYARVNRGDYFSNRNRFCLDVGYRYKLDMGLSFKIRGRYQHQFDRLSVVNGIYPDRDNVARFQFRVLYKNEDFKLLQPYFATEMFFAIQPINPTSALDTYRFKGGVLIDLPKRNEVKLWYTYEYENRSADNINHIWGIQYAYTLKRLDKKKKKATTPGQD